MKNVVMGLLIIIVLGQTYRMTELSSSLERTSVTLGKVSKSNDSLYREYGSLLKEHTAEIERNLNCY